MVDKGPQPGDEMSEPAPADVVDAAAVDADAAVVDPTAVDLEAPAAGSPKSKAASIDRPYPRRTLEDALRVPTAIREYNNGNPWPPSEVSKALDMGKGSNFFYLTQASRDFGLTEGTRSAALISLTELGRRAVFPRSAEEAQAAKLEAFESVELFRNVVDHYGGSNLPGDEFVRNTLQTQFRLDPRVHDEFIDLFKKNCRYVGIGTDWEGSQSGAANRSRSVPVLASATTEPIYVDTSRAKLNGDEWPVCFVIMPFTEHTDMYATGFFTEVFASLFKPAIEEAGFEARTAKRQGSDVIQATIVNELLDSSLVLCDLTEHNPNVLFELGVRMALEKPIVLVKAAGTNPIFDVDHMLRVESYNPNMWPSTVKADIPKLTAHIRKAYADRDTQRSYMAILRQVAVPARN